MSHDLLGMLRGFDNLASAPRPSARRLGGGVPRSDFPHSSPSEDMIFSIKAIFDNGMKAPLEKRDEFIARIFSVQEQASRLDEDERQKVQQFAQKKIDELLGVEQPPALPPRPALPVSGVGFQNLAANCWCNSLLQVIVDNPPLRDAYLTFAHLNKEKPEHAEFAQYLLDAIEAHGVAMAVKQSVPAQVTQNVRLALNHFFGDRISPNPNNHEDANEALQLIISGYEDVCKATKTDLSHDLYAPMEVVRTYIPCGEPSEATADQLARYIQLEGGNISRRAHMEYQILLDLQGKKDLSFNTLLREAFISDQKGEEANYLTPANQVQKHQVVEERRTFLKNPEMLSITVKRFGFNMAEMRRFKIEDEVVVPQAFSLPEFAAAGPNNYELSSFIVHHGGVGGGHYISYKQMGDHWEEFNDGRVSVVSNAEIERELKKSYMLFFKNSSAAKQAQAVKAD